MTLNTTPQILGEDKIFALPGSTTNVMPTVFTEAVELHEFVNKMPQMFTEKEKIEYKVLASKTARNILGARGAIEDPLTVYYTSGLLAAHAKMLDWQDDPAGCFWLVWYIAAQDRTVACRFTVDENIPTPTEEPGGLEVVELALANVDESIEATGDQTGSVGLGTITVTCVDGVTAGTTIPTASPTDPYGQSAVYKTAASVTLPTYDTVLVVGTGNWLPFVSGAEYTATHGHEFGVVYIDVITKKAKSAGKGQAVVA